VIRTRCYLAAEQEAKRDGQNQWIDSIPAQPRGAIARMCRVCCGWSLGRSTRWSNQIAADLLLIRRMQLESCAVMDHPLHEELRALMDDRSERRVVMTKSRHNARGGSAFNLGACHCCCGSV